MRVRVYRTVLWRCWLGDMEEHPVCKKLRVGMLMVMILPKLCTSYSSSCHHHAPPSSSAPTKSRTDALTQLSCHWYSNQHNDAFGVAWVRLAFGHHCHLWFHAFIAKNAKTFPVCIQQKKNHQTQMQVFSKLHQNCQYRFSRNAVTRCQRIYLQNASISISTGAAHQTLLGYTV